MTGAQKIFVSLGLGIAIVGVWKLTRKKGGVEIIDVKGNATRVKYKLTHGKTQISEQIFLGDKPQEFYQDGKYFVIDFQPQGNAVTFGVFDEKTNKPLFNATALKSQLIAQENKTTALNA